MKKENHINFEKHSAGRIMTKNIPVVSLKQTVGEVDKLIVKNVSSYDTINYIYVVDARGVLKGVVSIKELFRQNKEVSVGSIMKRDLIISRSHTDQEKAAYKALKNNIKAIPIVDKDGVFLGVMQSDNILNVLYEEIQEDIFHYAGVHNPGVAFDNVLEISVFKSLRHRFPWLFVGLIGGIFIAEIIGSFEKTMEKNIIVAAFIPLMVYMASAVGTQMSTFIIRDLAMNNKFNFLRYFIRQFNVVFLMAILSGLVFFFINLFFYKNFEMGIILSIAIFITILSSLFTGLVVPFILNKLRMDPANASGPLGTIMQDTLTVVIYFSVVSLLL